MPIRGAASEVPADTNTLQEQSDNISSQVRETSAGNIVPQLTAELSTSQMSAESLTEEVYYTSAPGEEYEGLHLNKYALPQGNGVYSIFLEAYADSRLVSGEKPADYFLVLDVSTSMSYFDFPGSPDGKRLGALQKAADDFIDAVAARPHGETEQEISRIALVQFANEEQSRPLCALTAVTQDGTQLLHDAIRNLSCDHLTRTDLGLQYAEQIIAQDQADREKIVILVTDGQPNNQDGFQPWVANAALACAERMKRSGIHIYALSIENHANVNPGGALPWFASISG